MAPFRYRDEDESLGTTLGSLALGAVAGFALGVVVAQKVGGLSGLAARVRERIGAAADLELDAERDELQDDPEADSAETELEERVLEAYRNDPILAERAIDIGAIGDGIIELSGWVGDAEETTHAVTVARGVPGVETVVNRLVVGEREELFEANARRFEDGDPALTEARWEGQRVGTGRRRQGKSGQEPDRHADPKPELEERWLSKEQALDNAAEDTAGTAERRRSSKKSARGDRSGGSPVAPSGVPKADHVAEPESAPDTHRAN